MNCLRTLNYSLHMVCRVLFLFGSAELLNDHQLLLHSVESRAEVPVVSVQEGGGLNNVEERMEELLTAQGTDQPEKVGEKCSVLEMREKIC